MKNLLLWTVMAVLFSSFECMERCHENASSPFVECLFLFEDADNVNLLTTNQLSIASIEIREADSGELLTFGEYNGGILVNFVEGEQDFILTTALKTFEFSVAVDGFQGECNRTYELSSFTIDGRSITFTQPVFTFRF